MSEHHSPSERLRRLSDKASLQATAHACLGEFHRKWSLALTIIPLVLSATLLTMSLAGEEIVPGFLRISRTAFSLVTAALSCVNFGLTLVLIVWRPLELASRHEHALNHYVGIQYQVRQLQAPSRSLIDADVDTLTELYLQIDGLPTIPDRKFLALKRWHKIKVAMSQELDRNPYLPLWLIRLRLMRYGRTAETK